MNMDDNHGENSASDGNSQAVLDFHAVMKALQQILVGQRETSISLLNHEPHQHVLGVALSCNYLSPGFWKFIYSNDFCSFGNGFADKVFSGMHLS